MQKIVDLSFPDSGRGGLVGSWFGVIAPSNDANGEAMNLAGDRMHAFSLTNLVDNPGAIRTVVDGQVAPGDSVAVDAALEWTGALRDVNRRGLALRLVRGCE
jgi:hypothetical protein